MCLLMGGLLAKLTSIERLGLQYVLQAHPLTTRHPRTASEQRRSTTTSNEFRYCSMFLRYNPLSALENS